jgi:hypothetical protein
MSYTRSTVRRHGRCLASVVIAAAVLFLWPAAAGAGGSGDAPSLQNPNATADKLANRFAGLVNEKDLAGLRRFVSPAYQFQRANGTFGTKADLLREIDTGTLVVERFEISDVVGTQDGPALVARYTIAAVQTIAGEPHGEAPAPRLSTFVWNQGRWRIAGHANFNVPTG